MFKLFIDALVTGLGYGTAGLVFIFIVLWAISKILAQVPKKK